MCRLDAFALLDERGLPAASGQGGDYARGASGVKATAGSQQPSLLSTEQNGHEAGLSAPNHYIRP